ncbi:capsular polysaccharide biosynthesis protein CapF [Lachnoclostridium sp.]|uniref:capsular polysaccharide biosynthesis protein CapF n=1 Tax=Lachnoclostridium sp. TaxID=2028282 RepID=UPI002898B193|nr:capsular polysaccharide biosynthesis protein CapF [Lachnoclostridium sp.]
MKILVTGAKGFIGKNLIAELRNRKYDDILEIDIDTDASLLNEYVKECEFVFHLAGINRPKSDEDFMKGNFGFTTELLNKLKESDNKSPILITSSIQAELDNPYGKSKKAGEEVILTYEKETGSRALVYRLPNVFGKWCRPNYNSAVATFCHNIANDLEIQVNDPTVIMNLVYIDDVIDEFINALEGRENKLNQYCFVPVVHTVSLGNIAELIQSFKESRMRLSIPNMNNEFEKKLYSTYLSYLPKDKFSYPLKMNVDERGSFTEFIRTSDRGQVSVNISKPGITKGNHWHHTKNEKFLVVKGKGLIQFREIHSKEVISYHVTGDKLEVVDIPTGYTHNIINEGDTELVTIMWANEAFNPEKPDTYFLKVVE